MTDGGPNAEERVSATITGRVQGVGFRAFTRRNAQRIGVTGWVRNEPDGSVKLEAEGSHKQLKTLLNKLQNGPRTAHVKEIETDWEEASGEFPAFTIRR